MVQVTGQAGGISSKEKGSKINATAIPHRKVTFSDRRDNSCCWNEFTVAHILQFCVFAEP